MHMDKTKQIKSNIVRFVLKTGEYGRGVPSLLVNMYHFILRNLDDICIEKEAVSKYNDAVENRKEDTL